MFTLACITKVLEQVMYIVVICNRMLPKYNVAATLQVYSVIHICWPFLCLSQMEPLGSSYSIEKLGYVLKYAKTSLMWLLLVTQCAGNRRTAMSETRKVKGVGWDVSAIGNGMFSHFVDAHCFF
jgi:hypothetical protein